MDSRKYYVDGENLPLFKINSDKIDDYIIINNKYKKYIVENDIVIGTKGSCGNIRFIDTKGYHKHGLLKFINFKIEKKYLYYYLKLI